MIICVCLFFSGCSFSPFEAKYPEEELVVTGGFDTGEYVYSDKVHVHLSYDEEEYDDFLAVKITDEEDWLYHSYKVLSDDFLEVAWNDFFLYIKTKNFYYTFDIREYEIPNQATAPKNKEGEIKYKKIVPEYNLQKYTYKEFAKRFPEYEDFEWYSY